MAVVCTDTCLTYLLILNFLTVTQTEDVDKTAIATGLETATLTQ